MYVVQQFHVKANRVMSVNTLQTFGFNVHFSLHLCSALSL